MTSTFPASTAWLRAARRYISTAAFLLLSLALASCAEQRIRNESQQSISAGDYERAVRVLEQGVKEHPESTVLRSGLVQARAEAMGRVVANAAALRAAGKLDEAERELQRAQSLDPQNRRLADLLNDLAT
jgi:general secretion pathway protein D